LPAFVGAYLNTRRVQDWVENHAVGLTMLNLNTAILAAVPIGFPLDRAEQQRIVEILENLDESARSRAIEIDRCRDVLLGLELDVSRRGEAQPLSSLARITMGQSPPSGQVTQSPNSGTPFLQGSAEFSALHPTPKNWLIGSGYKRAQGGAVLISVRAPVGDANLASEEVVLGRGLAGVQFDSTVPPLVGLAAIREATFRLRRKAQGSTFDAVDGRALAQSPVRLPPLKDMDQCHRALESAWERLNLLESAEEKQAFLNTSLRDDLLSGRVRV
jgi:type I restriction enzyme S subunit